MVALPSGYHQIEVTMFERGGAEVLTASWAGPDTGGSQDPLGPGGLFQEVPTGAVNNPPVLTSPGDQNNQQSDLVSIDLSATDDDGDSLYFDAVGLPEGLAVDHETGRIGGTLTTVGVRSVTASVSDGPDVSVVTFEWTVAEAPPVPDGGVPDGGIPDGGIPDGGIPDGGIPDGGIPDGGAPDGGETDGGMLDGGEPDGGMTGGTSGGGCSVRSAGAPIDLSVLLGMLALVMLRRRRPVTPHHAP
jgi:hypothetical protein